MSITEVFGEFRTGKSQLSMTASVICQLPKELGGADGKVAYIDTEGTFRPERIKQIAERFGVDGDTACENIIYGRALNSEHQMELLNGLCQNFATNEYRLLVSERARHFGQNNNNSLMRIRLWIVSWHASESTFAEEENCQSKFQQDRIGWQG